MKTTKLIFILFILLLTEYIQNVDTGKLKQPCTKLTEAVVCEPPWIVCGSDLKCQHKKLFP